MAQPEIETTDVAGYVNFNSFPVVVSLSSLNLNFQVNPKKYLLTPDGRKVNDPVLRRFVRAYGLSVELADQPVPLVRVVRHEAVTPAHVGFGGTRAVDGRPDGFGVTPVKPGATDSKVQVAESARPKPARPSVSEDEVSSKSKSAVTGTMHPVPVSREHALGGSPVTAISYDEAKRRGLIRPTIEPPDGVEDHKLDLSGEKMPVIGYARDARPVDKKPRGAAKKVPSKPLPTPEVVEAPKASVAAAKLPDDGYASEADDFDVAEATGKLLKELGGEPVKPAAVAEPSEPEPTDETAGREPASEPKRNLTREEASASFAAVPPKSQPEPDEMPDTSSKPKFAYDGKEFKSRSYLERYVRRKYPNEADTIMAAHPKPGAKRL